MPRVLNGALTVFLLLIVAPVVTNLAGKPRYVQVVLVLLVLLVVLVAGLCLVSALRPGALGRAVRRRRGR